MCIKFVDRVRSCKNFSEAFITGFKNLRISAFKDHAGTEMHKRAMNLFRRQECPTQNALEFAPIGKALCKMDDGAATIARRKFELTYRFLVHTFVVSKKKEVQFLIQINW